MNHPGIRKLYIQFQFKSLCDHIYEANINKIDGMFDTYDKPYQFLQFITFGLLKKALSVFPASSHAAST